MWRFALVCLVVVSASYAAELDDDFSFSSFMVRYGKKYKNEEEFQFRKGVFLRNLNYIRKHNEMRVNNSLTFTLAVNEYADMPSAEFVAIMNGYLYKPTNQSDRNLYHRQIKSLPGEVDWNREGYVTPIKNQGQCGSCWSFSTTGSLEGQHFKATGELVSLSEQNLMDCSTAYGNHGCHGGLMDNAFRYIIANRGIDTEASYPYEMKQGECRFSRYNVGSTCSSYRDIRRGDEQDLKAAVAEIGPISVAIDASHHSFQLYHSGVYNEPACSTTRLDHGVLVVGYGIEGDSDYWLVKNSWGPAWGLKGFLRMSRNRGNQCGIATQASYPIVRDSA